MAACCAAPSERYVDMELADEKASVAVGLSAANSAAAARRRRRRCDAGTILGSIALVLGLVSLAFSIYAAAVSRKVRAGPKVLGKARPRALLGERIAL